jgi:hypothetical protein
LLHQLSRALRGPAARGLWRQGQGKGKGGAAPAPPAEDAGAAPGGWSPPLMVAALSSSGARFALYVVAAPRPAGGGAAAPAGRVRAVLLRQILARGRPASAPPRGTACSASHTFCGL